MKLDCLLKGILHTAVRGHDAEITQIAYDSRHVEPGALFICLRGEKFDGHKFAGQAAEAGAAAVLVEESGEYPDGLGVIRVENTRKAMAAVSANFYGNPADKLRLIGVTGTNGKTTTTYFIEEILRKCGRKTGIIGTVGIAANGAKMDIPFSTSTTPDPPELHKIFAEMVSLGITDVVMEVSSHSLALFKMEGLCFDVGVFTNFTQDHLDFHGTMEEYKLAKAKLFAQSKFAVVNADDEASETMLHALAGKPFYTYGLDADADLKAIHIKYLEKTLFDLNEKRFELTNKGRFNIYNSLAAIGAAKALGLGIEEIKAAFNEGLSGVPGRIQSVPNARGLNVFVDYAHSPDGLVNIIEAVRELTAKRVITIFGCGGDRDPDKRPKM
ncbi:MAG: UDP-N-acetylmuramoyl-L-alanyl-D-glutamate--2,6-diaminopimelate ligase, partial [Clostridiales bacterium]|nr:UDP-N-acetylmuramoyl-L-alanyl-D-glutamate--2,6-diaminopimelate ligase [Clostridiales bacterium]